MEIQGARGMALRVNGEVIPIDRYARFHARRFDQTLDLVRRHGGGEVLEVGGHPWAMTARLVREPGVKLIATVSAEEITPWSDEIPVTRHRYELDADGTTTSFYNYSANIERTPFSVGAMVDLVLACEVIEHVTRAPHVMMLNINSWLKPGGLVVLTTPNGSQLENPFRVRAKMPAYRPSVYSRHNYVFTMDGLTDLVSACGFEVVEANFWSPYIRRGPSNLYRGLASLGPRYLKSKFAQTLCVVARKVEDRTTACRTPSCYSKEAGWERIDGAANLIEPSVVVVD
jgi:SAM-dependent methyltransferase